MTQNKKRKQSPIYSDYHDHQHDGKMLDDHDQNIKSVLFDEMTIVNSKLISIGKNFKLVDNLYFASNSGMIDEFIGNMQQFMKELELQRKKVAFGKLNSDILSHVYQFLNTDTLMNCCGLVCKLWKESLTGLKVQVKSKNIANFLYSSLVNHVTELKLMDIKKKTSAFISLSNSSNITKLKKLDLSFNELDSESIEYLMKCNMPNLTELNLNHTRISEENAVKLFNSNFMSNIKKLDLSYAIKNFTNNFYESFAESKYLNQITHLTIRDIKSHGDDLLLKNKFNLECLKLFDCELTHCPNLLMNGNYKNLKYLTITRCEIKNQEFVNLLVSPNLPNLETVNIYYLNEDESDKTIAVFPPNSQSSITELNLKGFNAEQFPSLFDHCPKLKKLTLHPELTEESKKLFKQMMKSPGLSNLEFLEISYCEIVEEIFINPIYSNLKKLWFADCEINKVKFVSKCTNLVNLIILDLSECFVKEKSLIEECSKSLNNNPTFSKLKQIKLPQDHTDDTDEYTFSD